MATCTICGHPKRVEIEASIFAGRSLRKIAGEFETSPQSVQRHSKHLLEKRAKEVKEVMVEKAPTTDDLLYRVENLVNRFEEIAVAAKEAKDVRAAIAALKEVRGCLDLLARLRGELNAATVNVHIDQVVNIKTDGDPDIEVALLIARATHGFDEEELRRFKTLAAHAGRAQMLLEADNPRTAAASDGEARALEGAFGAAPNGP
jgi:hypothetical protein